MNEMYERKEKLLSVMSPVCIHVEYQDNRNGKRTTIGRNVEQYLRYVYTGEITHFGGYFNRNAYEHEYSDYWYDPDDAEYVCFFDHAKQPFRKAYYLFYVLGEHSFHTPITEDKLVQYPDLPVIAIDGLITHGEDITDLCSVQFVDRVIALIDSGTYAYEHSDAADQEYVRSAVSADAEKMIEERRKENADEAVEYFAGMIADAMETHAEKQLQEKAERTAPNEKERKKWDGIARREYESDLRAIRNAVSGSKSSRKKKRQKRASLAVRRMAKGEISVIIDTDFEAYDRGRLMKFVMSTDRLYFGRDNVTIQELVEACPPDETPKTVLKNPRQAALRYISRRYRELVSENREEVETLKAEFLKNEK